MRGNWKFETLGADGGVAAVRKCSQAMRQTYRQEMEYLLELCGYETVGLYNDYCYSAVKDNMIWVVRK